MIPKSPVVSPRRGDCCCSGLCCTPESKHGRLLLFYFRSRKAVPGPFSAEHPAQQLCWWGESCGVSPFSPWPAPPLMGWVPEGESAIWQAADFASGRCLLPSQFKLNVCSPVTCSKLHSRGSTLLLHRVVWKSCMFWRGGVRAEEGSGVGTHLLPSTALQPEKHGHSCSYKFAFGIKFGVPALKGYVSGVPQSAGKKKQVLLPYMQNKIENKGSVFPVLLTHLGERKNKTKNKQPKNPKLLGSPVSRWNAVLHWQNWSNVN